jgi:hypothetical protein
MERSTQSASDLAGAFEDTRKEPEVVQDSQDSKKFVVRWYSGGITLKNPASVVACHTVDCS